MYINVPHYCIICETSINTHVVGYWIAYIRVTYLCSDGSQKCLVEVQAICYELPRLVMDCEKLLAEFSAKRSSVVGSVSHP